MKANQRHQSVKINFINSELMQVQDLKHSLSDIQTLTKKALSLENSQQKISAYRKVKKCLNQIREEVAYTIYMTKFDSKLELDSAKIQEEAFCLSYDNKIEELNRQLIVAENCLQYAQNIKKDRDRQQLPYSITNQKNYRKTREKKDLDLGIEQKDKIKKQFIKSIQLLLKAREVSASQQVSKIRTIGLIKNQNVKFRCYKETLNNQKYRKYKSQQKIRTKPIQVGKKSALELLFLSSNFKTMLKQAFSFIVNRLKVRNKESDIINKYLQESLELRNKNHVLKHLRSRDDLNFMESIAKMQLEALTMNKDIEQKMLGIESRRDQKKKQRQNLQNRKRKENVQNRQLTQKQKDQIKSLVLNKSQQKIRYRNKKIRKLSLEQQ